MEEGWERRMEKGVWRPGVEEGEGRGKGDGQDGEKKRAKEKRGKGASASASAFLAFFYLCLLGGGFKSGVFFLSISNHFYTPTCFSGRAVLVVFESLRAGAFDRVTGRQRDGTGRGGSGREKRYFREPAGLVVRSRPRIKALFRYTIFPLYS